MTNASGSLHWDVLSTQVARELQPFAEELLGLFEGRCGCLAVIGSSATPDFLPGRSDLNTALFLDKVTFEDLDAIAPLGVKYGPRRITAPLCFTVDYVQMSLDSFPIEFLNMKIEHAVVWGGDLFAAYEIDRTFLRLAAERELKGSVFQLQQYWIRAAGHLEELPEILIEALTALTPVFRALLVMREIEAPKTRTRLLSALGSAWGCDIGGFQAALDQRLTGRRIHPAQFRNIFERFLGATDYLAHQVDRMSL